MTRRCLLGAALAAFDPAPLSWIASQLGSESEIVHWEEADRPVSMGSLFKPFLVVAYAATHRYFPVLDCRGARDRCWLPDGHGPEDITSALANSCNSYFLTLAAQIDRAALDTVCLSYGLIVPPRHLPNERLIGLGDGWPQSPISVANAFARLARDRVEGSVRIALAGMARCASQGTAHEIRLRCYAKTGTAPCSHAIRAAGDGFVVAIYPMDQPRTVAVIRRHNATGARTASDVRALVVSSFPI